MVTIRRAEAADEPIVFELLRKLMSAAQEDSPLHTAAGRAAFHRVLTGEEGELLLAEETGKVLGLVTLSYPLAIRCGGCYGSIEEFIVSEEARGKGVGGKLLEAAIERARLRGCSELVVNRPSALGLPVYLRHGWTDAGKCLLMRPV